MPTQRDKAFLLGLLVTVLLTYSMFWLHERTVSFSGQISDVTLDTWTFNINVSDLSCILGGEKLVGFYSFRNRGDLFIVFSYSPAAMRNVGCDDFPMSGEFIIQLRPRDESVAIRRVLFVVENVSNVSVDPIFPKQVGFMYFKTPDGSFEVTETPVPGLEIWQAIKAEALRPTWGEPLDITPQIPLDVRRNDREDTIEARVRFRLEIEYLVRTGFFKSEKRKIKIEIPAVYRLYGFEDCTYGC
ncbi:hypothetical protein [Thermococcus thermotolerans]|uniref:hypothetical protein n=1 Tax=Thermococcus thermotolerans TaxID=2969672 RepID=UPI0021579DE1|nr:hypothetical protein [Thermococcus thermotolerans]